MLRPKRSGQGLVEFALVLPVFLLLMFGLFDIGRAVFAYNEITNAAREGARLAIVNQYIPSIEDRIEGQMPGTALAGSCVFFMEDTVSFPTCDEGNLTPSDECAAIPEVGCIAHVEVWVDFAPITPLVSNIIGSLTLTANSESAIEFVCPNPGILGWDTEDKCPKQP